jgi:hypothetical protein
MSMLSKAAKALFLFVALPIAAYAATDDPCAALIPASGAYQLVDQTGNHIQFNTAKAMYCSSQFSSSQQANSWNFGLAAEGYGSLTGGASNQASSQDRSNFCGDSSKDLTTVDKSFLYRLQGDATLVNGFVSCEQTRLANTNFTAYSGTAVTTGSQAVVTIVPHLSANSIERITSIGALGADPIPNVSIPVGTALLPNVNITGGYALTADQATLFIHTTTGDKTLSLVRCKNGTSAGTATATATVTTQESRPTDTPSWSINVPQASCHPHCHLGQGDVHTYTLQAPAGETLSNAQQSCTGNGCGFEDLVTLTQPDDTHLVYSIRSRSEAVTVVVTATGSSMVNVSNPVTLLAPTGIQYGTPFSVVVPAGDTNAILSWNGLSIPLSGLASGAWNGTELSVLDPGTATGGSTSYTFQVDGPACSSTALP